MVASSPVPRYDRIVSLVLIVVLGMGVVFLIDTNPFILRARLAGDLPTVTVSWLLIASLVVIAIAGADLLARSHPQMQTRWLPTLRLGPLAIELAPSFWIVPGFTVISSFAFFRLFGAALQTTAGVLTLVATGSLLLAALVAQHYALDRQPEVHQRARVALQALTYLLAFGLLAAINFARMRTLYSAPLVGGTGLLLAYGLLQWNSRRDGLLLSSLVGLVLSQATWALNYWPVSFLIKGALLLVLFHVLAGMLMHHSAGTLSRRLIAEYAAVGGIVLVATMAVPLVLGG